jgi:hypothetical protein
VSRLNDFTDALRNPHAWVGAIFIATLATVPTGLLDKLGETPRNTEAQQADEIEQAHRRDDQAAAAMRERARQCGGENAVGIPVPKGVQCYDHRGNKTKLITGLARPDSQGQESAARIFGVRLQLNSECANSIESAGLVLAGFLKG